MVLVFQEHDWGKAERWNDCGADFLGLVLGGRFRFLFRSFTFIHQICFRELVVEISLPICWWGKAPENPVQLHRTKSSKIHNEEWKSILKSNLWGWIPPRHPGWTSWWTFRVKNFGQSHDPEGGGCVQKSLGQKNFGLIFRSPQIKAVLGFMTKKRWSESDEDEVLVLKSSLHSSGFCSLHIYIYIFINTLFLQNRGFYEFTFLSGRTVFL